MKKTFEIIGKIIESCIAGWVIILLLVGSSALMILSIKYLTSFGYEVYNYFQPKELSALVYKPKVGDYNEDCVTEKIRTVLNSKFKDKEFSIYQVEKVIEYCLWKKYESYEDLGNGMVKYTDYNP